MSIIIFITLAIVILKTQIALETLTDEHKICFVIRSKNEIDKIVLFRVLGMGSNDSQLWMHRQDFPVCRVLYEVLRGRKIYALHIIVRFLSLFLCFFHAKLLFSLKHCKTMLSPFRNLFVTPFHNSCSAVSTP